MFPRREQCLTIYSSRHEQIAVPGRYLPSCHTPASTCLTSLDLLWYVAECDVHTARSYTTASSTESDQRQNSATSTLSCRGSGQA